MMAKKRKNGHYHPDEKRLSPLRRRLLREARAVDPGICLLGLCLGLALCLHFFWIGRILYPPVDPDTLRPETRTVTRFRLHKKLTGPPRSADFTFEGDDLLYTPAVSPWKLEETEPALAPGTSLEVSLRGTDIVSLRLGSRVLITPHSANAYFLEQRQFCRGMSLFGGGLFLCFLAGLIFRRIMLGHWRRRRKPC